MLAIHLLLMLNLGLIICLMEIKKILDLNYEEMKCNYKYYLNFKSFTIVYGFMHDDYEYLIADKFVLKRSKTLRIKYANHSDDTFDLFLSIKKSNNTIFKFDDSIDVIQYPTIDDVIYNFKNIKNFKRSDLESNVKETSFIFQYSTKKLRTDQTKFDFFIQIHRNGMKMWRQIEKSTKIEQIKIQVNDSKIKIDSILFHHFNQKSNQFYKIIEFYNSNDFMREYRITGNDSNNQIDHSIRYLTYPNLLNCAVPLCEGGRYKGLISVSNRIFFFLDEQYSKIDSQEELFDECK